MAAESIRWSCSRCGVSVGQMDGVPTELPASWSRSEDQVLCLTCSRAQAGEAAMDAVPDSVPREDRVKVRRTALIEFEIERAPEAPNATIARACRTSSAAVKAVRDGVA